MRLFIFVHGIKDFACEKRIASRLCVHGLTKSAVKLISCLFKSIAGELANIFFAYGNSIRASDLYGAMAAHWQRNPGDPERAVPNHIALIRLGIISHGRGNLGLARYFLLRALDSLSPTVSEPDTRLAELLLEHEETQEAAQEYLDTVAAHTAGG